MASLHACNCTQRMMVSAVHSDAPVNPNSSSMKQRLNCKHAIVLTSAFVVCSEAGLKLIVDNSTSPNSHLGPHTRVSWSVDTNSIAPQTAAVALAISSEDLTTLRMVAFTLFQTRVDPRTGVAHFPTMHDASRLVYCHLSLLTASVLLRMRHGAPWC